MNRLLLQSLVPPRRRLGPDAGHDDANLLDRYAESRDERAFEELLTRHGPVVWGVCRRMLPLREDAEDAFQATFVALIRLSESRKRPRNLAGWLVNVATRVCLKCRRSAVRARQRQEKSARPEAGVPVADQSYDAAYAAFQDEVNALPDALRVVYLVCELGGTPHPAACIQLGLKPSALTARLTRARQRLEARLTARGLAPAIAAVVLAGTTATLSAMPTRLVMIVQTLSASPATVPLAISILATPGVTLMATKLKLITAGAMALTAATLSVGVGGQLLPGAGAQEGKPAMPTTRKVQVIPAPPKPPAPPAADVQPPEPPEAPEPPLVLNQRNFDLQVESDEAVAKGVALRVAGPPKFEYRVVPASQAEVATFETLLESQATEGFEYAGLSPNFPGEGKRSGTHLVFKRPNPKASAVRSATMNSTGGMTFEFGDGRRTMVTDPRVANEVPRRLELALKLAKDGAAPDALVVRLIEQAAKTLEKKPEAGKSRFAEAHTALEAALNSMQDGPKDERAKKVAEAILLAIKTIQRFDAAGRGQNNLFGFGPTPVTPPAPPTPPAAPARPSFYEAKPVPMPTSGPGFQPRVDAAAEQQRAEQLAALAAQQGEALTQYSQLAELRAKQADEMKRVEETKRAAQPRVVALNLSPNTLNAGTAQNLIKAVYGKDGPKMIAVTDAVLWLVDTTPEQEATIRKLIDQAAAATKASQSSEPKKP